MRTLWTCHSALRASVSCLAPARDIRESIMHRQHDQSYPTHGLHLGSQSQGLELCRYPLVHLGMLQRVLPVAPGLGQLGLGLGPASLREQRLKLARLLERLELFIRDGDGDVVDDYDRMRG